MQFANDALAMIVDGVDAAEEVLPGVTKDITSGKIKPKQADVAAIAKAPAEERRQLAENLYKKPTPEEKARNKNKRDLMKAIRMCDATHIPSDTNKITPQDITFFKSSSPGSALGF